MNKCKILIPIGCRSDEGLSKPIIKRLKEDDFFNPVHVPRLNPAVFYGSYGYIEQLIWDVRPDLIFITGDRIEMCAAACAAFHNNVPIAHYFAGVLNCPLSTLDDVNRHCITLWSDIQLVESNFTLRNVALILASILKESNCYVIGSTHLEDLEIDESLVPEFDYDLILINAICEVNKNNYNLNKEMYYDVTRHRNWKHERKEFWIQSNPDFSIKSVPSNVRLIENLPRPQFLGLLKNCKRFITNSSAAIYEAPFFLKKEQIIMVGDRNKNRTQFEPIKTDKLASEKIVEILKNWWRKKQNAV